MLISKILLLWTVCVFSLFCSLISVTNFAYFGSPLVSSTTIAFSSIILNFWLFFSILSHSVYKSVLQAPGHYYGKIYFLFSADKMIFTYWMILFFSSIFSSSLPIVFLFCCLFYKMASYISTLMLCFAEVIIPFNEVM